MSHYYARAQVSRLSQDAVFPLKTLRRTIWLLLVSIVLLSLTACSEQVPQHSTAGKESGLYLGQAPEVLARAVDSDQLRPEVVINGINVNAQRATDGGWSLSYTLFDSSMNISLRWIELYNGQDLVLASWSNSYNNISANTTISIDPSQYQTTIHDADADGVSNLAERSANTDPFSSAPALQGEWFGDCTPEDDGDSEQDIVTYDESRTKNYVFSSRQYISNTTCTGDGYVSINLEAVATITGDVTETLAGEAQNLDITFVNGTVTAGQSTLAALEREGTSLEEIFAAEGFENIQFIPLAQLGVSQTAVFTIYQIDGDQLRLGVSSANRDGTTRDNRYTVLDISSSYIRQ